MADLYTFLRPLLFAMKPEFAHKVTVAAMKAGAIKLFVPHVNDNDPALRVSLWGVTFPNAVGMAAGFDKNADVPGEILSAGFGHVELGTVTPRPQDGNPKPRVFRYAKQEAIINRMGFPSGGMNTFKANMSRFLSRKARPAGIVGINIGMNKNQIQPEEDYRALIRMLGPMADYLAVNISSPNTPGLRNLQEPEALASLLATLDTERKKSCGKHPPPLLVKFAPDLEDHQLENIAKVVMASAVDGVILTNTTLERPDHLPDEAKAQAGGLSGKPLTDKSTEVIRKFYNLTGGKVPIIGVGGVSDGHDAYAKIRAGASMVQLYTGLIYKGPSIARTINSELLDLLKADGFKSISEAVGADAAPDKAKTDTSSKKAANG